MSEPYLQKTYDLQSDDLIEVMDEMPLWSAPFGLKLLQHIRLAKNITALDIGFGAGFPLTELAMRLGDSCKVYGIDPWEAAIKRAEKKIRAYGITNIEIITGAAEEIPVKDSSIDLITSNNGLNNVQDLQQCLSECARVIKKGGQFVQSVNLDTTMTEFYEVLKKVMIDTGMEAEAKQIQAHIYEKRKPLDAYLAMISSNQFEISEIVHDHFEYRFTDGTAMFNHYFIQLAFLESWRKLVPEVKQKQTFREVETILNERAQQQGYLQLSVPFVVIDATKK
jgi:ubiquinone/menaquinone biosynthesis C-methylase UbiE